MSRLERLELVVRSLADRILGETITFDEIAEQEAAEKGVAYTQPLVTQAPEIDIEEIARSVLSRLPAHDVAQFDAAPLLEEIAVLKQHVSAADRRHIEQETIIQTLIQATDALLQRLQATEGRLDQHRDVINGNHQFSVEVTAALVNKAEAQIKGRDAA